jgi:hypothetical protein
MIDPVWRGMVHWHAVTDADYGRDQANKELTKLLSRQPNGRELVQRFGALGQKEAA